MGDTPSTPVQNSKKKYAKDKFVDKPIQLLLHIGNGLKKKLEGKWWGLEDATRGQRNSWKKKGPKKKSGGNQFQPSFFGSEEGRRGQ